jgi:hypothetical protein
MSSNGTSKAYVVPKLTHNGANWITWKNHMLAMLAPTQGVMHHVKGSTCMLVPLPTHPSNHMFTDEEEEALGKVEKH